MQCLKEIRLGFCSKVNEVFIKGLSRNLEDNLRRKATHISTRRGCYFSIEAFCTAHPVKATDRGDTVGIDGIQRPAEKVVMLKQGFKV